MGAMYSCETCGVVIDCDSDVRSRKHEDPAF